MIDIEAITQELKAYYESIGIPVVVTDYLVDEGVNNGAVVKSGRTK